MLEGSRTFQNGLSDPDFRCRPRQICERRGKDIKVEWTPFRRFSTGSRLVLVRGLRPNPATGAGEPVEEDRSGWEVVQEELQPYAAADLGFLHEGQRPYASADHFRHPVGPASSPRIPPESRTSHRTVPGRGTREGSRGGRTPTTFRGYGRWDRPAAEEGLGGPSSCSLFPGLSNLIPSLRPGNDILEVEVQEDVPDEEEEHDMIQGMDRERLRLGSEKRNRLSAIEYL
ncbi:hypothetical protein GEV33_005578 [Tenebrio molitor]|uniref:Uncharacterized protein n=1 Tax=Tenebrio molitor TaxID=7067 RepID=A0A8J6HN01_TENMO|nr:hypothetical protein GEV33_005578 [Tenebrio molitor]